MESFGHTMFISSQPVPLTGTGVMYPRVRDFCFLTDTCSDWVAFYRKGMGQVLFRVGIPYKEGRHKKVYCLKPKVSKRTIYKVFKSYLFILHKL